MSDDAETLVINALTLLNGVISHTSFEKARIVWGVFFNSVAILKEGSRALANLSNCALDVDYTDRAGEIDMVIILGIMKRNRHIKFLQVWKYPNANRKINDDIDFLAERDQFHNVMNVVGARNEYVNLRIPGEHVERVKELLGAEFDLRNFKP